MASEADGSSSQSEAGQLTVGGRTAIKGYLDKALAYHAEIAEMAPDRLEELWHAALREEEVETEEERIARGTENDRFGLLNRPNSQANIPVWMQRKAWSPEQAVALSLGKDPKVANPGKLQPYRRVHVSAVAEEYGRRLEMVHQACELRELKLPITPMRFIKWARANNIGEAFQEQHTRAKPDEDPREINKMYTIILAASVKKYHFDRHLDTKVKQPKKPFVEIAKDAAAIGLSITPANVRSHVRKALDWANREKGVSKGPTIVIRHGARPNGSKDIT